MRRSMQENLWHGEEFRPADDEDFGGIEFEPTDAPRGSESKVEALAERYHRGLPLWHPNDSMDVQRRGADVEEPVEIDMDDDFEDDVEAD